MKGYRRQFVKRAIKIATEKKVESRDAILWDFYDDSNCGVKIQGSDEIITAHFPRNLTTKPEWLKLGNSVRISHRGGVRGYIEVIGPGRAIPAPTSGNALPPTGGTGDGIIYGLQVTATSPVSVGIEISNGAYRINQAVYYYTGEEAGFIIMQEEPVITMGVSPYAVMGESSFVIDAEAADPPPVGYVRFDLVVIGINGQTDYIVGAETTGTPVYPDIPVDHILVAPILRVGGDIGIPQERIYAVWTPRKPTTAKATYSSSVAWATDQIGITVSVYDQYGVLIRSTYTDGWKFTLEKIIGTGEIYSSNSGWDDDIVEQNVYGGSGYTFTYRRNKLAPESKPFMYCTIECGNTLYADILDISMLDENGLVIT